jgi:NAD(P)-dependent dehydrogenase (short-subunit alcohol dehydrogenase family)
VSKPHGKSFLEPAVVPGAPSPPRLAGKVALVTGGGRGMGRGYALRLGQLGAAVAVADLNLAGAIDAGEASSDVISDLEAQGTRAIGFDVDVGDRAAVEAMIQGTVDRFGSIDVLVCNAGVMGQFESSSATIASPESLRSILEINLMGTINCCQAAARDLKAGGWGKVVNVSSLAAIRPQSGGGFAPYVIAKGAVIGYTLSLAAELAPHGVTVNAIAPGSIDTPMTRALFSDMDDPDAHARVPLGRFGEVEDVAGVIEFLCTPLSDYVTGQVICVDGGLSITDALVGSGVDGDDEGDKR